MRVGSAARPGGGGRRCSGHEVCLALKMNAVRGLRDEPRVKWTTDSLNGKCRFRLSPFYFLPFFVGEQIRRVVLARKGTL